MPKVVFIFNPGNEGDFAKLQRPGEADPAHPVPANLLQGKHVEPARDGMFMWKQAAQEWHSWA
jgi:hypothetical protein